MEKVSRCSTVKLNGGGVCESLCMRACMGAHVFVCVLHKIAWCVLMSTLHLACEGTYVHLSL